MQADMLYVLRVWIKPCSLQVYFYLQGPLTPSYLCGQDPSEKRYNLQGTRLLINLV